MLRKSFFVGIALLVLAAVAMLGERAVSAQSGSRTFRISIDNVGTFPYKEAGVFNTPVGAGAPGPLLPGNAFEWNFRARPGDYLSFATMAVQSNDFFFAPNEIGIPLFGADGPTTGDVTSYVDLWDAGTEFDEPPGEGAFQAPRQAAPNLGAADPNNKVRRIFDHDSALPAVADALRATLRYSGNNQFTLRLENISGNTSLPTPLSPGVGIVHTQPGPLFVSGHPDRGLGLEAIAEDGNPAVLGNSLHRLAGRETPISPGGWTVSQTPNALFTPGTRASRGIESLAEDGSPAILAAELGDGGGVFTVPRGASAAGPALPPHGTYTFEITAEPGDHLSLATMFVQTNDDMFVIRNLPLFKANGSPIAGNITHHARIYDAGTEVDQPNFFGSNQAPRQAGPNVGAAEGGIIHMEDGNAGRYVHINITPLD